MCSQYLTSIQMCNSACSSKMDSFSFRDWRITSKSLTTLSTFTLFFFYFLTIITCCFYIVLNIVHILSKCQKSSGKSNLQVKYVKKSTSKKAQLVETTALLTRWGSRGTVSFRWVHGRALVGDQGEKPLAFLHVEEKTYLCIVVKTYLYKFFTKKKNIFIDSFVSSNSNM